MKYFDANEVAARLPYQVLIDQLREAFRQPATAPVRSHYSLGDDGRSRELLLMPVWNSDAVAIKAISIFPENSSSNIPTINGVVMLFDGHNGQPLAVIDAGELTARRTAAASALASSFLSRESSRHLLLVGSGRLVPHLIRTHCIVRDICKVTVCGRSVDKAEQVAEDLAESSDIEFNVCAIDNLEHAMRDADIVSLATSSSTSIIKGDWLVDGQHLDLVGAYRPDMREVDDACIQRAVIFVDTLEGTLAEAGDLIQPIKAGVIEETAIVADLHALCSGTCAGRQTEDDVTLFKSVGTAIEDLAAATLLEH